MTADASGYKSVAYQNVVPILVEAMKQQQTQIQTFKKESDAKDSEITAMKARLDAIEWMLQRRKL